MIGLWVMFVSGYLMGALLGLVGAIMILEGSDQPNFVEILIGMAMGLLGVFLIGLLAWLQFPPYLGVPHA